MLDGGPHRNALAVALVVLKFVMGEKPCLVCEGIPVEIYEYPRHAATTCAHPSNLRFPVPSLGVMIGVVILLKKRSCSFVIICPILSIVRAA